MDINQGPVIKAQKNINKYNLQDKIEVRKSDGLKELASGEAEALIIAGMGGELILKILSGRQDIVASVRELILQPQSAASLVREAMRGFGFIITGENMLAEDGKFYVCLKAEAKAAVKNSQAYELTDKEHIYFGRLLLEQKHPVLYKFLKKERMQCEEIFDELIRFPTRQSMLRQGEIMEEIRLIDLALKYYE
jgi:tRNA (adenine22-N1)-methyltransferase